MRSRMPREVWALGLVSMFMDISSEMIHSLLPMFMVSTLGASMLMVGTTEGLAEATALVVKVFSGPLSDWAGKRKPLALAGYGLGALSKPFFALAPTMGVAVGARLVDRVGKGIRGAPRDALVADVTPPELRGAAFGLRQSLDTVGAFLGPLLAVALMWLLHDHYRTVFNVAIVPAVLAVVVLAIGVREPARAAHTTRKNPLGIASLKLLGSEYWWVVGVGGVFTIARFSEAFLVLRAQSSGVAPHFVPLLMVVMNVVYAVSAYPIGKLSDRIGPAGLLTGGVIVLALSDVVLAMPGGIATIAAGCAIWGLHMGMTQGILAALVANSCPAALRGTAFGFFNLFSGMSMLLGSSLAGGLWQLAGPSYTFAGGAILSLCSLVCIAAWTARKRPKRA